MPHLFNEDSWPTGVSQSCEHRVELVIERGEAEQLVRRIEVPVFLIGASPDCDLVLGDRQFADHHASISCGHSWVAIRNLGGLPDITVNSRITRWAELRHADRLRMGPYQFRVRMWSSSGEEVNRPGKARYHGYSCLDIPTADFMAGTMPWATPRVGGRPEPESKGIGINRIASRR